MKKLTEAQVVDLLEAMSASIRSVVEMTPDPDSALTNLCDLTRDWADSIQKGEEPELQPV